MAGTNLTIAETVAQIRAALQEYIEATYHIGNPALVSQRRLLIEQGHVDEAFVGQHANGFEAYRQFLLDQNLAELCEVAGVPEVELAAVARRIGRARGFLSFYCMGLNQSTVGVWKNNMRYSRLARSAKGPRQGDGQLAAIEIDIFDKSNVAVVDLLVIVVLDLHDLITRREGQTESLDLAFRRGVQCGL